MFTIKMNNYATQYILKIKESEITTKGTKYKKIHKYQNNILLSFMSEKVSYVAD